MTDLSGDVAPGQAYLSPNASPDGAPYEASHLPHRLRRPRRRPGPAPLRPRGGPGQRPDPALTQPWTGPFVGVPAFDKVRVEDFRGAIDQALAAERAEIDAIAGNKAPPTFANTIEALEQTGQMTSRVLAYYFIWTNTLASPEVQKVEEAVEPLLAAHQDAILQNAALFRRIDAV